MKADCDERFRRWKGEIGKTSRSRTRLPQVLFPGKRAPNDGIEIVEDNHVLPRIEQARASLNDLIASLGDDQIVAPAPTAAGPSKITSRTSLHGRPGSPPFFSTTLAMLRCN